MSLKSTTLKVVGISLLSLLLSLPYGRLYGQAIELPLEVLSARGMTDAVVDLPVEDLRNAQTLFLQVHGLKRSDLSYVRLNAGAWIKLLDEYIIYPDNQYGGVGGGYHTLRFEIPVADFNIDPNRPDVTFTARYLGADASDEARKTDNIGFRVLQIDLRNASGNSILPAGTFTETDPDTWTAPVAGAQAIERGRDLWFNKALVNGEGRNLLARCADCHSAGGEDLEYYSYSNRSIVERSKYHGLDDDEARDIASFIRSLSGEGGRVVGRLGRPWNPPYQPGTELRGKSVDAWAAGAGIDAVGDDERATLEAWLGTLDPSPEDIDAIVDVDAAIDVTKIPLAVQLPDWNNWLPTVHPKDAWPTSDFDESEAYVAYENLVEMATDGNPESVVADAPFLATANALERSSLDWMYTGNYDQDLLFANWKTTGSTRLDAAVDSSDFVDSYETAKQGLAKWVGVKYWEVFHNNDLEDKARTRWPEADPWQWPTTERSVHQIAPHIIADNKTYFARNNTRLNDSIAGLFESSAWYQLQNILNSGQGNGAEKTDDLAPTHFQYGVRLIQDINAATPNQRWEGARWYLNLAKMYQVLSNGKKPEYKGWMMRFVHPTMIAGEEMYGNRYPDNLDSYNPGLNGKVQTALFKTWLKQVNRFSESDWTRRDIANTKPGGVPPNWYQIAKSTDTIIPLTQYNTFYNGQRRWNRFTFAYRDYLYDILPRLKERGDVDCRVLEDLAAWGEKMWPGPDTLLTDWSSRVSGTCGPVYTVRARGLNPDGQEYIQLLIGGEQVTGFALTDEYATYTTTSEAIGDIRVAFGDGVPENDVQIDWLEVDGDRREAEAQPTNTGVRVDGVCGGGYSEFLHCAGYILFEEDPVGQYAYTIRARGLNPAGQESIHLEIGGERVASFGLTDAYATYSTTTNATGEIRVAFDDNVTENDVQVDWLELDGDRREAEAQPTNTGVRVDGVCGGGYSEFLHCAGYILFEEDPVGQYAYTIRARGTNANTTAAVHLEVGGERVATFGLTNTYANYSVTTNATGAVRVAFDDNITENDVQIDWLELDGDRREAEAQPTNTGVRVNGVCGGGYSEFLHCAGYILFEEDPVGQYAYTVRARGLNPDGQEYIRLEIGGEQVAVFTLTDEYAEYAASTNATGDIRVAFADGDPDNDVQIDWLEVDGDRREAEAQPTNTGVRVDGVCGGGYSEFLHCAGYILFEEDPASRYAYVLRARGTSGTERVTVEVGGQEVGAVVLGQQFATYTFPTDAEGVARVYFNNDGYGRDVQVDYLEVDGERLEAERQATNTGLCQGGAYSDWLFCNGYVEFAGPGPELQAYALYARGVSGEEVIEVTAGEEVVRRWTMPTGMTYLTFYAPLGDLIRVHFTNDAPGRDAQVDYLEVGGVRWEAESQFVNTGLCRGGSYSEWLYCGGYIEFAGPGQAVVPYVLRGRGKTGTEELLVTAGGTEVRRLRLRETMTLYGFNAPAAGPVRVHFVNDQGVGHDAIVDYLDVDGQRRQAEDQAVNTGRCEGLVGFSEEMACAGYIEFSPERVPTETYVLRARGTSGTEVLRVLAGDYHVATVRLTPQMSDYEFRGPADVAIRTHFDVDAGTGYDVRIDYLEVGDVLRQAEAQAVNTGRCTGGIGYSEWMHCAGYIEFAPGGEQTSRLVLESEEFLNVYPNPTSGPTMIVFEVSDRFGSADRDRFSQVRVSTALGQVVSEYIYPVRVGRNELDIDVRGLSAGTYVVTVQGAGPLRSARILVQP